MDRLSALRQTLEDVLQGGTPGSWLLLAGLANMGASPLFKALTAYVMADTVTAADDALLSECETYCESEAFRELIAIAGRGDTAEAERVWRRLRGLYATARVARAIRTNVPVDLAQMAPVAERAVQLLDNRLLAPDVALAKIEREAVTNGWFPVSHAPQSWVFARFWLNIALTSDPTAVRKVPVALMHGPTGVIAHLELTRLPNGGRLVDHPYVALWFRDGDFAASLDAARGELGGDGLCWRLALPHDLRGDLPSFEGGSIALAARLACRSLARGESTEEPYLAIAVVEPDGSLSPPSGVQEKLRAAVPAAQNGLVRRIILAEAPLVAESNDLRDAGAEVIVCRTLDEAYDRLHGLVRPAPPIAPPPGLIGPPTTTVGVDWPEYLLPWADRLPRHFTYRVRRVDFMPQVLIPEGTFTMGSPEGEGAEDEHPQRRVTVSAFWMDLHPVTVTQFRRFRHYVEWPMPPAPEWGWHAEHPIVNVTWEDAQAYCQWVEGRLPTEAEWEYAARGGVAGASFVWGDQWPPVRAVGNLADESAAEGPRLTHGVIRGYDDGFMYTSPVASFPPNPFGLFDFAGNVCEWCQDSYAADWYARMPDRDPCHRDPGPVHVGRGGSFTSGVASILRIAFRFQLSGRDVTLGFRCVNPVPSDGTAAASGAGDLADAS